MNYLRLKNEHYRACYTVSVHHLTNELGEIETLNYLRVYIKKMRDVMTSRVDCLSLVYNQNYMGKAIITWSDNHCNKSLLPTIINSLTDPIDPIPNHVIYYDERGISKETGLLIGIEKANEYLVVNEHTLTLFVDELIKFTKKFREEPDSTERNEAMANTAYKLALKHFSMDTFSKATEELQYNTAKRLNSRVVEGLRRIGRKITGKNIIHINYNRAIVYSAVGDNGHLIKTQTKDGKHDESSLLIKPIVLQDLRKGNEGVSRMAIEVNLSNRKKSFRIIRPVYTPNIRPMFYMDDLFGMNITRYMWDLDEITLSARLPGLFISK